jgi:hypothetical protein
LVRACAERQKSKDAKRPKTRERSTDFIEGILSGIEGSRRPGTHGGVLWGNVSTAKIPEAKAGDPPWPHAGLLAAYKRRVVLSEFIIMSNSMTILNTKELVDKRKVSEMAAPDGG